MSAPPPETDSQTEIVVHQRTVDPDTLMDDPAGSLRVALVGLARASAALGSSS
jgi:hypothetical protein